MDDKSSAVGLDQAAEGALVAGLSRSQEEALVLDAGRGVHGSHSI
jgi:hypothetical protein